MDDMRLDLIRGEINGIDAELVRLLDRRARAGREAAARKRDMGLALFDPGREQAVLARIASLSDGGMPARSLERIYRLIMTETLSQEAEPHSCPGRADGAKQDVQAEIVENAAVAPGFRRMRLKAPQLAGAFSPGQFFQLRIEADGAEPFLRRPFAPSETGPEGFSFVYAVVGDGTRRMAALQPGRMVGVLAPLGTAYTLPESPTDALLIGGGCGAPSLAPLARALKQKGCRVHALIGARTSEVLLEHETYASIADRLIISTDDGTRGCRGTVIDALANEAPESLPEFGMIYACGPARMLKAAAALAAERGVSCEVSLEERMACGFGACVGCVVATHGDSGTQVYKRVCHDGPVFDARRIVWDCL